MGSKKHRNRKPGKEIPGYVEKVMALAQAANFAPGTVQHINVHHDDWCDLLNHRGACNCHPAVKLEGTN